MIKRINNLSYSASELRTQQVSIRSDINPMVKIYVGLRFSISLSNSKKRPRRRIRAHYEHFSEFERGRIIGLKDRDWEKKLENRSSYSSKQCAHTGKNGWTMADFSVMMVAVDLGPHQIRRTD
ncbi:hypothetical protein TNCV_4901971 [Trichonephila clavipes]|nr:hypothetical protein TNCV_4901971 [Trichonephila clavipes]